MNKKGQVTIFIIIGILALLLISVVRYTRVDLTEKNIDVEVPVRTDVISSYVQECLDEALAEGLEIISVQGGYIYIPDGLDMLEVKDSLGRTVVEENGRKKVVLGNGLNQVPYWLLSYRPDFLTPGYMIDELERYIVGEIEYCVDDFKVFKDQNYEIEYEPLAISVSLGEVVLAEVNFPITATRIGETMEVERFQAVAPVNLRLISEIALNIAANEEYGAFIEDSTNNLISLYSGVDSSKLPPTAATIVNTDCSFATWDDSSVEQNLKKILDQGMGYVKIKGTNYESPKSMAEESFLVDTGIEDPNIKINFDYRPEWEFMDFDVKPTTGPGINTPDKLASPKFKFIPKFCTYNYRYKYDLEYPVLVTITDSKSSKIDTISNSYESGGYSLNIPLWIVLAGNQKRVDTGRPAYQELGFEVNSEIAVESKYVETMFCDEKQKLSSEITIDAGTSGVSVYYYCGNDNNNCYIGKTGENGKLSSKFPLCYNGMIHFNKKGYVDKKETMTTINISASEVSFEFIKKIEMNYTVKAIPVFEFIKKIKESSDPYTSFIEIERGDRAIITMNGPDIEFMNYPDIEPVIELAPGDYNVDVELMSKKNVFSSTISGIEITLNSDRTGDTETLIPNGEIFKVPFSVKEDNSKREIEFLVIANKGSGEDISGDEFTDLKIVTVDGLNAELLYDNCTIPEQLLSADDTGFIDFHDSECRRTEILNINSTELKRLLEPRII